MSAGYLKANGIVPNTSYEKANVRFSANAKLNKRMNVTSSWTYVYSINHKPIKGQGSFYTNLLSFPTDMDIREYQNPDGTRKLLRGLALSDEVDNPLWEANKNYGLDKTNAGRVIQTLPITLQRGFHLMVSLASTSIQQRG